MKALKDELRDDCDLTPDIVEQAAMVVQSALALLKETEGLQVGADFFSFPVLLPASVPVSVFASLAQDYTHTHTDRQTDRHTHTHTHTHTQMHTHMHPCARDCCLCLEMPCRAS